MKKSYTDENTGISYTLVGDIYLPNLLLPDTNYSIGLWGERHRQDRFMPLSSCSVSSTPTCTK